MSELTPEEALEQAALAGVHCLPIPTPFSVGKINCYLIEDEPLTLIDTGPNSGKSLDVMQEEFAAHGHSIDDLEQIVITHNHMDHIGLVEILVEHSGAEVVALDKAAQRLENFSSQFEAEDEFAVDLMLRQGIPAEVTAALHSVSGSYRGWASDFKVTKGVADGEVLQFGDRGLQALWRPGHSPMDTLFWDEQRKILIVGDHLLAKISSNPLISRPLDGSPGRTRSLVAYNESLRKTREMPAELIFGGHGPPITDHVELIDARLASTERRKEKIFGLIEQGPKTGHEIAQSIWGNIAVTQAYLTLSEVIGHIDLLEDEGRVREVDDGKVIHYEVA